MGPVVKLEAFNKNKVTIELPDNGKKVTPQYLWIGLNGDGIATLETKSELKKLRKMIDRVLDYKYPGEM